MDRSRYIASDLGDPESLYTLFYFAQNAYIISVLRPNLRLSSLLAAMCALSLEAWLHPSLRLVGAGIQQELRHCHVAIAGCTQQSGETSAWAGAA